MSNKADNKTVLVVDDHDDIRELLRVSLETEGCRVVEASNGREAVELAPKVSPGLILMDLSMPVLDGYEAARQIHQQPQMRDIPIVAVSAYCDPHNKQKALAAGCVDCVGKPVDFAVISGLLERYL